MKICVLVKEVPDAAVEKKIDPSTGRMDRSGEKNLNPYDTHAIEAAMQIKEGGAVPVEEIVAVTMGPDSAVRALHKAVSLGADRSVHLSRDPASPAPTSPPPAMRWPKTLKRESPDLVLLGQQSDDGECYTIGAVVAEHLGMPSLTQVIKMDVDAEALRCERQAEYGYDTVQIKLPARDLRGRRDQRAALSVAEGDHGRAQEEAPRHASPPSAMSRSTPRRLAAITRRLSGLRRRQPPAKSAGEIIEDEDTGETVEKIIAWLDERRMI
jgi:electron transfer flavoprotein beta subunit